MTTHESIDLPNGPDINTVLAIARAERASITGLVSRATLDALITAADNARRALASVPVKTQPIRLTEADLEALPSGTVVIDKDGDALIKTTEDSWVDKYISRNTGSTNEELLLAWTPLRLLYTPAPTPSDS